MLKIWRRGEEKGKESGEFESSLAATVGKNRRGEGRGRKNGRNATLGRRASTWMLLVIRRSAPGILVPAADSCQEADVYEGIAVLVRGTPPPPPLSVVSRRR